MHEHDAGGFRLHSVAELDRFTFYEQMASRRCDMAGQQLHQRRLARAILADDGVDLSGTNIERDVRQDGDRTIGLAEPVGSERRNRKACRRRQRLG